MMTTKPEMTRTLGLVRMAAGFGILAAPRIAGWLFAGEAGRTAAVSIFARGFAARDIAIGAGLAAHTDEPRAARPWLAAAMLADAADALAVLLAFRELPPRHRSLAFVASILPAAVESLVLRSISDSNGAH